jgi:hypothetical protein
VKPSIESLRISNKDAKNINEIIIKTKKSIEIRNPNIYNLETNKTKTIAILLRIDNDGLWIRVSLFRRIAKRLKGEWKRSKQHVYENAL